MTHYPVVAIPLAVLLGYVLAYLVFPDKTGLLSAIAFMGCSAHFIHDSWDEFGIPWFWPFKASRYRIRGKRIEEVTRQEQENILSQLREKQRSDNRISNELAIHTENISRAVFIFFCCMLVFLLLTFL